MILFFNDRYGARLTPRVEQGANGSRTRWELGETTLGDETIRARPLIRGSLRLGILAILR